MENKTVIILTILVIIVVVSTVYFISDSKKDIKGEQFVNRDGQQFGDARNFSLSQDDKSSTVSFFENTSNIATINNYCQQNRMNCMYYCREINSEHEVCSGILKVNMTRREMDEPGDRPPQ